MRILVLQMVLICGPFVFAQSPEKDLKATTYEWSQLTDQGVFKKSVMVPSKFKNQENPLAEFQSLTLQSVKISTSPTRTLKKVVILGDSGCRVKDGKLIGGQVQDCSDPKVWPYEQVVRAAQQEKPDLIIHVGDYHYREKCFPGHPCEKVTSAIGYGWLAWEYDFFRPSQGLNSEIPWLFVRGNHEDCERAHLGWRFLLSTQQPITANTEAPKECLEFEPTEYISWGDLLIVNFDSSAISEFPEISDQRVLIWKKRLEEVNVRIEKLKPKYVWFATHKPVYGFAPFAGSFAPININLKKWIGESTLKSKLTLLLAGHVHVGSMIQSDGPLQVISGNAGSALDHLNSKLDAKSLGYSWMYAETKDLAFGYTLISRENAQSDWLIESKDKLGKTLAKCLQHDGKNLCQKN